jgi:predicted nucleic acid-binding Zn ribbon protein
MTPVPLSTASTDVGSLDRALPRKYSYATKGVPMQCPSCSKEISDQSIACNFCGKSLRKKSATTWVVLIGFLVLVLIVVGLMTGRIQTSGTRSGSASNPPQKNLYVVPHEDSVMNERFTVKAGESSSHEFTITPQMEGARLVGKFEASGGNGNDIQVCVATSDEFRNWINGNEAKIFYGRTATVDSLDLALPPGAYTVGFSNKHAILFSRNVTANLILRYTTKEYR